MTLAVDDNELNQALIEKLFCRFGRGTLSQARTLDEARRQWTDSPPDLVLLDLQLPDGFGLDLLSEFGVVAGEPAVIVLTATATEEMADRARASGALDLMAKPVDVPRLGQVLRTYLGAIDSH